MFPPDSVRSKVPSNSSMKSQLLWQEERYFNFFLMRKQMSQKTGKTAVFGCHSLNIYMTLTCLRNSFFSFSNRSKTSLNDKRDDYNMQRCSLLLYWQHSLKVLQCWWDETEASTEMFLDCWLSLFPFANIMVLL